MKKVLALASVILSLGALHASRTALAQSAESAQSTKKAAPPITLEAEGQVVWDRTLRRYAAEGDVRLTRAEWVLTADILEATYPEKSEKEPESESESTANRGVRRLTEVNATGSPVRAVSEESGLELISSHLLYTPTTSAEARVGVLGVEGTGYFLATGDPLTITDAAGSSIHAERSLELWEDLEGRTTARALGPVVASGKREGKDKQGKKVLKSYRMEAEQIWAYFADETIEDGVNKGKTKKVIEEYQASGGVSFTQSNGAVARGDRARYSVAGEWVILEGGVRLEDKKEGQILEGERARIDLRTERAVLLPPEGGKVGGSFPDPSKKSESESESP